ncbi:MAG: isoprenylcysteine carboxylmethyltransferase family protein [Smithellaceae bacterium]|nr:isoprenylcysteine carboxylmethyltransferase family protein [Smithellaceae bacterium]
MKEFDPFGWLERYFSAKTLHVVIRCGIMVILLAFLISRITSYNRYWFKPLWAAETLIFVVFLISYAIRRDPVSRSRGVREILIPLIGGVLPFTLLFSPSHRLITGSITHITIVFIWMTVATCLTIWGLWTLKHSFSITVEARELVTGGPYRFIRHPVYLGEMLTTAAVAVLRFSPVNVALLLLFVAIQLYRSRMEENKLVQVFPAYGTFAARSLWFWPHRPVRGR